MRDLMKLAVCPVLPFLASVNLRPRCERRQWSFLLLAIITVSHPLTKYPDRMCELRNTLSRVLSAGGCWETGNRKSLLCAAPAGEKCRQFTLL